LRGEFSAQARDGGVNQEADIRHRKLGDAGDFLVAKSILKFQAHDFLLVRWQMSDHFEERGVGFGGLEGAAGPDLGGDHALDLSFLKALHPPLLAQHIKRPMATDREKPLDGVPVDRLRGLRHEFDKGILHHIARAIRIPAEEAGGVSDKRSLLLREGAR
jgi:hypothetical protein